MRNALYLLLTSLLILAGCNNQGLESSKQSVSKTHQVKINLGDDLSSRSNRYKGNYADVVNGGSVILHYSFPSAEGTTEELEAVMKQVGTDWSVDLVLATGQYTFWANAYDSDQEKIFETATARSYQITTETESLNLGLQLNPILEDVGGTLMPVVTQLSKPSGYFPGTEMEIYFTVKGSEQDYLEFFVSVYDNASNELAFNWMEYPNAPAELNGANDNITTYQDSISVEVPADVSGPVMVLFGVGSETLQSGSYLQFMMNEAVEVSGGDNSTMVFVPTIDEFWLGSNADDNSANTLQYWFEISGNQGFSDNVSFAFDSGSGSAQVTPMDSGFADERMGTLYRSVLESGTLTITFTSVDGQYSYSYDYAVPGGPTTEVDTYIPSPPSNYKPPPSHNSIDGISLPDTDPGLQIMDTFSTLAGFRSYELEVRDGTALYVDADSGSIPLAATITASHDDSIVGQQIFYPGENSRIYLPAGHYSVKISPVDSTGSYEFHIYYADANVIRIGDLEATTEWQPLKVRDSWPDNATKRIYDIYIGQGSNWQLNFTQAVTNAREENILSFCLTDGSSTWGSCNGIYPGDASFGSASENGLTSGWYTLEVVASGWANLETTINGKYDVSSIRAPGGIKSELVADAEPLLLQDPATTVQEYVVEHDCSSDIVIHTDNAIEAKQHYYGFPVSLSSEDSVHRIAAAVCNDHGGRAISIFLTPSEGTVNFSIQLETPPHKSWNGAWAVYETAPNDTYEATTVDTPDNFKFELVPGDRPLWIHEDNVTTVQQYIVQHDCNSEIVIITDNVIEAKQHYYGFPVSLSSNGSTHRITTDVCKQHSPRNISLFLTPSEEIIHFGIQLKYTAITQDNIQSAVELWADDQSLAELTYGPMSGWDVSSITNMAQLFTGLSTFNEDISSWDVSNVTTMSKMFEVTSFDQDIGSWDVRNVTDMSQMFQSTPFNQDIGSWDVSSVTSMHNMFRDTPFFNQDIGSWDVSSVTTIYKMFMDATAFNQDLSGWCVTNATASDFGWGSSLQQDYYPVWGTCPQ